MQTADTTQPHKSKASIVFLFLGAIGLVMTAMSMRTDLEHFYHSYLVAYVYWLTLALGGLFLTMLHHLTGAKWSVVLRRLTENIMMNLPLMFVFFLPLLFFGMHHLYEWTHPQVVLDDHLLSHKAAYLNVKFFTIRSLLYFAIWFWLARHLYRYSLAQDQKVAGMQDKMRRLSAPGMVLLALTLTFSAIDWLMSLSPHWFSTMFGVYIFAGAALSTLALLTQLVFSYQRRGLLVREISVEHYHDLGKLMFAFTVFWTYIAFCQYLLIWYSNIPEETVWFVQRWQGSWKGISCLIVIGHFVVPFLALLARAAKRSKLVLNLVSLWILFIHWVDIYWIVMPNHQKSGAQLNWIDLGPILLIGGVWLWWFNCRYLSKPLLPVGDADLEASIHFENA